MKQTFVIEANANALLFRGAFVMPYTSESLAPLNQVPDDKYALITTLGYRHHLTPPVLSEQVFALIYKARYDLPPATEVYSSDPLELAQAVDMSKVATLQAATSASDIDFAEDVAPIKQNADVVVKQFTQVGLKHLDLVGLDGSDYLYQVYVDNDLWLQRNVGQVTDAVADWYPKTSVGRKPSEVRTEPNGPLGTKLTLISDNDFYQGNNLNAGLIKTSGGTFAGGEKLLLKRQAIIGLKTYLTSYRFKLPPTQLQGRYYYYCNKGPDQPSCWCSRALELNIDTVEVYPDQGYLNLSWRAHWFDPDLNADQYREVKLHG